MTSEERPVEPANRHWPELGCGVGLRNEHYDFVTTHWPKMDWFEAVSENFMDSGGRPLHILEKVRARYPVVLHGTSLSIAGCDAFDYLYLERLKKLIQHIEPAMVSDHLCWSGVDGERLYDLLPLPFTEEALNYTIRRVQEVQDFLGRQILIENVSTYIAYRHSVIPEWEFISTIAKRAGCGILLDVNNVYVNAFNHGFLPEKYLDGIPGELVGQIHLAGHTDKGPYLFDTHSAPVIDPVWNLYRSALKRWGRISTLIEWDEAIPSFPELSAEADKARKIYRAAAKRAADYSVTPPTLGKKIPLKVDDLLNVQRWMKTKVQPEGAGKDFPTLPVLLHSQASEPGEVRLKVYSDGYLGRFHESLKEAYEAVRHLLGEGTFISAAEAYAREFPSQEYNLSLAGRHFPEFLKKWEGAQAFPFLPNLAELEWLIVRSFHAFDEEPAGLEQLQSIPEEQYEHLVLAFQHSVALKTSDWPLLDLWKARKTPVEEIKIDITNRPQNILIFRRGEDVFCHLLETGPFVLLQQLLAGHCLGDALETAVERDASIEGRVQELFAFWMQNGLIRRFTVQPEQASSQK